MQNKLEMPPSQESSAEGSSFVTQTRSNKFDANNFFDMNCIKFNGNLMDVTVREKDPFNAKSWWSFVELKIKNYSFTIHCARLLH